MDLLNSSQCLFNNEFAFQVQFHTSDTMFIFACSFYQNLMRAWIFKFGKKWPRDLRMLPIFCFFVHGKSALLAQISSFASHHLQEHLSQRIHLWSSHYFQYFWKNDALKVKTSCDNHAMSLFDLMKNNYPWGHTAPLVS